MSELLIPKVGPIQPQRDAVGDASLRNGVKDGAFDKALRDKLQSPLAAPAAAPTAAAPLKFSAHALSRIQERGIKMDSAMMGKLEKAVDTASQKGSKDSLILSDDAAFIVSIKNKTVITVLDRGQMNGNVFTNIDSTVVI